MCVFCIQPAKAAEMKLSYVSQLCTHATTPFTTLEMPKNAKADAYATRPDDALLFPLQYLPQSMS